ncbi:MAG: urease accessory protein UreF, partial [Actinomycetota bacterium]|nr:urease accessory protein UreF [Actinomycetota bacterium]
VWPGHGVERIDGRPPMQPVVFGALAAHIGCSPLEAATGLAHGTAAALTTAALRLLSLDPFSVAAVLDRLRPTIDAAAATGAQCPDPTALPHRSTPFAELDPELQLVQELRLFGS